MFKGSPLLLMHLNRGRKRVFGISLIMSETSASDNSKTAALLVKQLVF